MSIESSNKQQQLQILDVNLVDVLAHLEALLRYSHLIQRALLTLRSEAPPPSPDGPVRVLNELNQHLVDMRKEWEMLGEIINDLIAGTQQLSGNPGERP